MSALLESLLTPVQRAEAEAHDARQFGQRLHPLFADILDRHAALPLGPYPTAKWPEGLTHLQQPDRGQS